MKKNIIFIVACILTVWMFGFFSLPDWGILIVVPTGFIAYYHFVYRYDVDKVLIFIFFGVAFSLLNNNFSFPWWVYLTVFIITGIVFRRRASPRRTTKFIIGFNICFCFALLSELSFEAYLITIASTPFFYYLIIDTRRGAFTKTSIVCLLMFIGYWVHFVNSGVLEFDIAVEHVYNLIVLKAAQLFLDLLTFSCSFFLLNELYNAWEEGQYYDDPWLPANFQIKLSPQYLRALTADLDKEDITGIRTDLENGLHDLHRQKERAQRQLQKWQGVPTVSEEARRNGTAVYPTRRSYDYDTNDLSWIKNQFIDLLAKYDAEIRRGNERLNEVRLKAPKHRGFSNQNDFGTIDGLSSSPFYDTE